MLDFADSAESNQADYNNYVKTYGTTYTEADFETDKIKYDNTNNGTLAGVKSGVLEIVDNLWTNGSTKFIDSEGRAIIYGTDGVDKLLDVEDDLYSPNGIDSELEDYYENSGKGIVKIGGKGNDVLFGTVENDHLLGGNDKDVLRGLSGNDILEGGEGIDSLYGGEGEDTLIGGNNNDYLDGGTGADTLQGGSGNDTYITTSGDNITDSDGKGSVYLANEQLDGGVKETITHIEVTTTNYTKTFIYCECNEVTKWSETETDEWEEKEEFYLDKTTGTKYILNGSTLSVISNAGTITINNFAEGDLGISLTEKETIDKDEVTKNVFLEEDFCSPLVLDLNHDGKVSTNINDTSVYFDMDNDGYREKTAWVSPEDGLLVRDINNNGKIDNGSELFGNFSALKDGSKAEDGFEALLQYDSNYDGKIDNNDEIYQELKVWKDTNSDGITDEGELHSLQSQEVKAINLNPIQSILSFFDTNKDGKLTQADEAYNYILLKQEDNGNYKLYLPQIENSKAKELFKNFKGSEIIETNDGSIMIEGISFASIENISTLGDDVLEGTSANDKIIAQAGDFGNKMMAANNIYTHRICLKTHNKKNCITIIGYSKGEKVA